MLQPGETAPSFTLPSTAGDRVGLNDALESGPAAVITNRGAWCSYCAEQLQTFSALAYDLWRHLDVDVLPVLGDPVPDLVEMRDRYELRLQLLADTDLDVAAEYSGLEDNPKHGEIPVAGTFVIDEAGVVQYAQVAENPADRTYANYVRALIRDGFDRPYADG